MRVECVCVCVCVCVQYMSNLITTHTGSSGVELYLVVMQREEISYIDLMV